MLISGDQSVEQSSPVHAEATPPNQVTTRVYDMFNVPLGNWWADRYQEVVLHNAFPYIYKWYGVPSGNTWVYSDFRMNVTARNMVGVNTLTNPIYVPITNPNPLIRGGVIKLDWKGNYIDGAEASKYGGQIPIWYDSWYFRLNGTVTMDKVAAKMVLNMTDSDFDNFNTWKPAHFPSFTTEFSNWLLFEMNYEYDIFYSYDWPGNTLFEQYDIIKSGQNIVFQIKDLLSWGMESLLGRWWKASFLQFEGNPEDVHFTGTIGTSSSDFNLDMAVQYSLAAKTSTRGNQSCWAFESSHGDCNYGSSSHYYGGKWYNYSSELNPYAPTSGTWNSMIGNAFYGSIVPYDSISYTPWAWNLSAGQNIIIEWPSSTQIPCYNYSGDNDFSDSQSGGIFPIWVEPVPSEIAGNFDMDPVTRKITITGPLDVWSWSKQSIAATELKENWSRIGLLPRGCPYIEFGILGSTETAPTASFSVTPPSGNLSSMYHFDASSSHDNEDPTTSLTYTWDWEGDGVWDTTPSNTMVVSRLISAAGTYNVKLKVMDTKGATDTAQYALVVYATSPPISFLNCSGTMGMNGWYVSPVNLTLNASAPAGINWTKYRIDNADWVTYSSPVTISKNGDSITFEYYSRDLDGNSENFNAAYLKIDTIAPESSAERAGLVVFINSSDVTSGMNLTRYRIDGGEWIESSDSSVSIDNALGSTIEYYSIDKAGNAEDIKSFYVEVAIGDNSMLLLLESILIVVIIVAATIVSMLFVRKRRRTNEGSGKPPLQ
jgi:hypothetical protein